MIRLSLFQRLYSTLLSYLSDLISSFRNILILPQEQTIFYDTSAFARTHKKALQIKSSPTKLEQNTDTMKIPTFLMSAEAASYHLDSVLQDDIVGTVRNAMEQEQKE
jgi:hypothetical protein